MKFPIEMNKHNKDRLTIFYDITLACNNRCEYCYASNYLDNTKLFNHDVFEKFKKAFNDLDRSNEIELFILGGDPFFTDYIQRLNELDYTNVSLSIYSNLNFPFSVLCKRLDMLKNLDFDVIGSYHESSNIDYFKRNILYLKDGSEVIFLVSPRNISSIEKEVNWCDDNGIPYTITPLGENGKLDSVRFKRYDLAYQERVDKLLGGSVESNFVNLEGYMLDAREIYKYDLHKISHNFFLLCKLSWMKVSYYGEVTALCSYNCSYDISEGFKSQTVLCSNNDCRCDNTLYKKLLRGKNTDGFYKFSKYFGDKI